MSFMNTRPQKRLRSMMRAARKQESAKRIPFLGVYVTKQMVKTQRYLRNIGLSFSKTVASVFIRASSALRRAEEEWKASRGGLKTAK